MIAALFVETNGCYFNLEGGSIVKPGHVGTIYQATNGRYIGKTNPATLRMLPDGTVLSNRTQRKVFGEERGASTAFSQLERWGAEPLAADEDPREWLRLWRARLTSSHRHRGNHRYVWCLDKRRRSEILRAPALAYPKIGAAA